MSEQRSLATLLSDPRLAPHALADHPVWLWSADATQILWGNPAAAAIFGLDSANALAGHGIDPKGSTALQIACLAGSLLYGTAPRLERLRGFGGRFGGALLCACSRITLHDRTPALLIVSNAPAGPSLSLAERARRLLAGSDQPVALFAPDGALLHATPSALERLGDATSLTALGIAPLGAAALASGHASGDHSSGRISLERIGNAAATALLASFMDPAAATQPDVAPVATATAPEEAPPQDVPSLPPVTPTPDRQPPLRFVWQMDADGRFTIDSEEFKVLLGPLMIAALGRPWDEIAKEFTFDPAGQVARAVASRETWSGITVAFPAASGDDRVAAELSGLPVFDCDRSFCGYRGFGVCRGTIAADTRLEPTRPPAAADAEPPLFRQEPPQNVVRLRTSAPSDKPPTLTSVERSAFTELASRLTARLRAHAKQDKNAAGPPPTTAETDRPAGPADIRPAQTPPAPMPFPEQRPILDLLPIGVLVYRLDRLIYANRAFLDWTGYENLAALEHAGGLDALFVEPTGNQLGANNGTKALTVATNRGGQLPVEARLFSSPWEGESALVLMLTSVGDRRKAAATPAREGAAETGELRAILDATADGVLVLDQARTVLVANRSAELLFGYGHGEMAGLPFAGLLAPEARRIGLEEIVRPDQAPGEDREVAGRRRDGSQVHLLMTVRPIAAGADKLCVTVRDITRWKDAETENSSARRQAERMSAAKSEFIARLSHEIRTPLNSIMGFTEVMAQERFGPIGNDRYRQYLKDIRSSGGHLVSLLNDLLDLSRIEAGKLDLNFANVDLNELTQECVGVMQAQASRERIIIRTSLAPELPPVTADARSVRQIALNLLSNSIKFTGAGGQVIVSTALGDDGGAVLRVRDTGIGMSEQDLAVALEPFRQLASAERWGSGGSGLGLPLTKALAEANRASFKIRSAISSGTLVEVAFPGTRLAAE